MPIIFIFIGYSLPKKHIYKETEQYRSQNPARTLISLLAHSFKKEEIS